MNIRIAKRSALLFILAVVVIRVLFALPIVAVPYAKVATLYEPSVEDPSLPLISEVPRPLYKMLQEVNEPRVQTCEREGYATKYVLSWKDGVSQFDGAYVFGSPYRDPNAWRHSQHSYECSELDVAKIQKPADLLVPWWIELDGKNAQKGISSEFAICTLHERTLFKVSKSSGFSSETSYYNAAGIWLGYSRSDDVNRPIYAAAHSYFSQFTCDAVQARAVPILPLNHGLMTR